MRLVTLLVASMLSAGCVTQFTGAAKVPNGAVGCKAQCSQRDMELAGMVVMGEYSDGCICQVRNADKNASQPVSSAAVNPAAVGVFMQMQRQQQQNAANASSSYR